MNKQRRTAYFGITAAALIIVVWTQPIQAQTFSSGSTGTDGAFNPTCSPTPCSVTPPVTLPPSGVFNFTTVDVPPGSP